MSNDKEFPDGIMVFKPREGAPSFVKGAILLKKSELINWLNTKHDEEIRLDILESQNGKYYSCVNDYKPTQTATPAPTQGSVEPDDIAF